MKLNDYPANLKPKLGGLAILQQEFAEFAVKGEGSFANPQSMAEGGFEGKYLTINGKRVLDLTRLDYLALGQDASIRQIMKECISRFDIGCPASQMVMRSASTLRLENALSELHGMDESIVFTSGYSANVNVIQALGLRMNTQHLLPYIRGSRIASRTRGAPTIFFIDSESHFSVVNAVKTAKSLSMGEKCQVVFFSSGNEVELEEKLEDSRRKYGDFSVRVIVSDVLSSISGKVFNIPKLCQVAELYDCLLYLDEAHSVGVLGTQGRGIASSLPDFARYRNRMIVMGTLTKAFSQLGGYVSLSNLNSAFLRAASPQYIFSAPVPPWMAETVVEMLSLLKGAFGEEKRNRLEIAARLMREELNAAGFNTMNSDSYIIPVVVGDVAKSGEVKKLLEQDGFMPARFIYPAVPKDHSLIRFSVCADVTEEEVMAVVKSLKTIRAKISF